MDRDYLTSLWSWPARRTTLAGGARLA